MSMISSFLGSSLVVLPSKPIPKLGGGLRVGMVSTPPSSSSSSSSAPMVIECSSRPQKKGTAHHRKTRPKKTQPWDIKRKPTVYAPLPKLPSEWSLASTTTKTSDSVVTAEVPSSSSSSSDNNNNNNNDDA